MPHLKTSYSCHVLNKLEFSRRDFRTNLQITKFYENSSYVSGVFPCGQTDREDEVNTRFSQLHKSASIREISHTFETVSRRTTPCQLPPTVSVLHLRLPFVCILSMRLETWIRDALKNRIWPIFFWDVTRFGLVDRYLRLEGLLRPSCTRLLDYTDFGGGGAQFTMLSLTLIIHLRKVWYD